jgi:hypothetical protein
LKSYEAAKGQAKTLWQPGNCADANGLVLGDAMKKNDSGNRRQGGGGWGTPLKKRSAARIKSYKELYLFSGILNASGRE